MSNNASGHWVTLHGGDGDGTHVFIGGDGTIEKGPGALTGKKIHDLKASGHHSSETHHREHTDKDNPPAKKPLSAAASKKIQTRSLAAGDQFRLPSRNSHDTDGYRTHTVIASDATGVEVEDVHGYRSRIKHGSHDAKMVAKQALMLKKTDPASAPKVDHELSAAWLGPVADARDFSQAGDGLSYWKDVLTLGNYVDPKDGRPFAITPALYTAIEASFAQMQAIGDEPPIVKDHKETADSTLGYIKAIRRSGDKLQALHKFADAGARDVALRNKVSVRVRPDVQLSNGQRTGLCLTHVAITPRPVLTNGMNDWDLALSRGSEGDVPETYFAAPAPTKELNMTAEQLERAKKIVPTATDENAIDLLLSFAETESKNSETTTLELSQVKAERDTLMGKVSLELSNTELAFGKRAIKGDLIEVTAKWPQVAKDAAIKYATADSRTGLMLSQVGDGRNGIDDFADFCRAIPLKGLLAHDKETTSTQELRLSRDVPDADTTKTKEQTAEAAKTEGAAYQARLLAERGLK